MDHKLSEIEEEKRTATCTVCGHTRIKIRNRKGATPNSRWRCIAVYKKNHKKSVYPYSVYKKAQCEHCGFMPSHSSQLDVDHIDGDRFNNDPKNLQTLCANCHRLKTHLSGDSDSGIF
jgi:Zn finger protein HypA/HybF involved in hydrogenase expression